MNDGCSVLVLSCDKNQSVLNIYFDMLQKNWKDCPYKIYLGIEEGDINYPNVITLKSPKKKWAERVKDYLNAINEKNVFIILDDFIVEKKVETEEIKKYVCYMNADDKIATISIADIYDEKNYDSEFEGLVRRTENADYLLNLQAGIWNKKVLIELLRDKESPWQTELYGSIRARKYKDYKFFCLKSDENSPYKYGRGWLLVRGCWNGNEIKRLQLEKYYEDIFDGKDILFSEISQISTWPRIIRRINIIYRKILSRLGIYI